MTPKEYLSRAWLLDREITALKRAKRRAYDRCVSGVASVSGAPSGGGVSDGGMSRYAAFADEIDRQLARLSDIKREVSEVISHVPDTTLRTLLVRRYLSFEKWENIAVEMNYSWRQVMRLHGQALREVAKILPDA